MEKLKKDIYIEIGEKHGKQDWILVYAVCICAIAVLHIGWMCLGMQRSTTYASGTFCCVINLYTCSHELGTPQSTCLSNEVVETGLVE